MLEEEKSKEYEAFLEIIYTELEKTLELRPKNPVTNFAKKYAKFPFPISYHKFQTHYILSIWL